MIKVFDNIIPEEFCNEAIQMFEIYNRQGKTFSGSVSSSYGDFKNDSFLVSTDLRMDLDENLLGFSHEVAKYFSPHVASYLDDFKGVLIDYSNIECSDIVFSKYPKGVGKFALHKDAVFTNYVRSLTILTYFNDVSEGGVTYFPNQNMKVTPKKGRVVVFPSNFMYAHEGQTPEDVDKYVIVHFAEIQIGNKEDWEKYGK